MGRCGEHRAGGGAGLRFYGHRAGRLAKHAADQAMEGGMGRGDERRVMMRAVVVGMVIV